MECFRVVLVFLLLAGSSSAQQISTKPSNKVVRVGEMVQFDCGVTGFSSGNIFQWLTRNVRNYESSLSGDSIFEVPARATGEPSDPTHYEIEGTYNLQIKEATLEDAGWYLCQLQLMRESGTLIVVEQPTLNDVFMFANGLTTRVACEAKFSGPADMAMEDNELPKMSFYLGGKLMSGVKTTVTTNTDGVQTIKGAANYTANHLDHGKDFECRVYVESPSFMAKAEQTFNIDYEPTNITVFPSKQNSELPIDQYNIGDTIRCGAEGHPDPKIGWVVVRSPGARTVLNYTLEVLGNMVGYNKWYCQASNGIGTVQRKDFEFTVLAGAAMDDPAASSKGGLKTWAVAVIVIVVLLIVAAVVILLIYFFCYKKRKSQSADTNAPMTEKPTYENKGVTGDNVQPVQGSRPIRPQYANAPNNNKMISPNPNPALQPDHPIHSGRDSPGFADLGTQQIRASNPELNLNSSFDRSIEHDQSFSIKPDAGYNNQTYQGSPSMNSRPRAVPPPEAYATNTEV